MIRIALGCQKITGTKGTMRTSIRLKFIQTFCFGILAMSLGACTTTGTTKNTKIDPAPAAQPRSYVVGDKPLDERYPPDTNEPHKIKPLNTTAIPTQFQRTVVSYPSREVPGTIIVEPHNHYLYFIAGNGKAIRYGVGVGAAGLGFEGSTKLQFKRKWPRWTPTKDMIARNPGRYKKYADGVPGGPSSPLGARALYLFQNNVDTYYRIHGTTQPSSIGKSVSAGCIRMLNQDVIDLYERVGTGATVIVR